MSDWVAVGRVARAHGVRGVVRVAGASAETLRGLARVFVGDERRELRASSAGEGLLKLEGVDDRDAAEALRGADLWMPRDELPAEDEDELYLHDLLGCRLTDGEGAPIGTVTAVESTGAQDLLVVQLPSGREARVPYPLVTAVDLEARTLACDLPEGLLEL